MVSVYNDADFLAAYKQKQKIFRVFMGVTIAYLAFCAAWLIYYISLPYASPAQTLPKWCVYVASALYAIFLFPYMGIKYSRVNRYYKMLSYLSTGLKNEETNYFYAFDDEGRQKDYVDVTSCLFETWSKKKCEWLERKAYCDKEKPLPPFDGGDYVHYIVQSNFVIQYEILQKRALEFEEVDDETDEEMEAGENEEEVQASEETEA